MARLFGTDGVRGLANDELTVDLALRLAQAAAVVLGQGRVADGRRASGRRPVAVVARDPRVSGEFLSAAVGALLNVACSTPGSNASADCGVGSSTISGSTCGGLAISGSVRVS